MGWEGEVSERLPLSLPKKGGIEFIKTDACREEKPDVSHLFDNSEPRLRVPPPKKCKKNALRKIVWLEFFCIVLFKVTFCFSNVRWTKNKSYLISILSFFKKREIKFWSSSQNKIN